MFKCAISVSWFGVWASLQNVIQPIKLGTLLGAISKHRWNERKTLVLEDCWIVFLKLREQRTSRFSTKQWIFRIFIALSFVFNNFCFLYSLVNLNEVVYWSFSRTLRTWTFFSVMKVTFNFKPNLSVTKLRRSWNRFACQWNSWKLGWNNLEISEFLIKSARNC